MAARGMGCSRDVYFRRTDTAWTIAGVDRMPAGGY
jgi:hypothetical protein